MRTLQCSVYRLAADTAGPVVALKYVQPINHYRFDEGFNLANPSFGGGTYVAVEPYHLERYIDEQIFRFNNRATKENPLNDADRFTLALSQIVGKRLTYDELTGKTAERPL